MVNKKKPFFVDETSDEPCSSISSDEKIRKMQFGETSKDYWPEKDKKSVRDILMAKHADANIPPPSVRFLPNPSGESQSVFARIKARLDAAQKARHTCPTCGKHKIHKHPLCKACSEKT